MSDELEKAVLTPAQAIELAQAAVTADEAKLEALLDAAKPATPAPPSVGMGSTATAVPRAAAVPRITAAPAVSVGLGRPATTAAAPATLAAATIVSAAPKSPVVPEAPITPDPAQPKKVKFVKLHGISDVLTFKDGSSFQFRWIQQSNGQGYQSNSFVETSDAALIKNLRETAKNKATGVVEVSK